MRVPTSIDAHPVERAGDGGGVGVAGSTGAVMAPSQPRGRPSTRSPTSVRCISLVPAKIEEAW